jgi:hypothetical protein
VDKASELKDRLVKLQKNYDDIQQAMLGIDWETKRELKFLSQKVAEEIKKTLSALQDTQTVEA